MSSAPRVFIFGLGYSALAFADVIGKNASISGTTRSKEKAAALSARGIDALVFDGVTVSAAVAAAVNQATHIVMSIAPGEADPVLAHCREAILAAPNLRWLCYLSTVGIYGNFAGAWVNERTTPRPEPGRTTHRLATEKAWAELAAARGVPLATFRIAGIYGPGRNALVNLAEGKAHRVVKAGQVFNRIHVEDIGAAVAAAFAREAGGVFNLADDEPAPPQDVVAFAASLMGVSPPPEVAFEEADLSPMARSFYGENKRVSNAHLKAELGVALRYPTYREGLTALWQRGNWRSGS
jgi:nucleoside-diphosphate-sugar epimerase